MHHVTASESRRGEDTRSSPAGSENVPHDLRNQSIAVESALRKVPRQPPARRSGENHVEIKTNKSGIISRSKLSEKVSNRIAGCLYTVSHCSDVINSKLACL